METNRLRQFRAIVETGNMRKAAEILGISHSGLSKSMKILQEELNLKLLLPSGRGIVITDQGKRLYEESKSFLLELDRLLEVTSQEPRTFVRLGSFEVFTSYFLGPLMTDYLKGHRVQIHELAPGRLEQALSRGRIDLGITYEPVPHSGVEFTRITSIPMGAYVRKGSFLEAAIEDIPFIAPAIPLEGTPSGARGLDAWPEQKIKRKVHYRVDLMNSGIELVCQGLGAIFIPQFVADLHNQQATNTRKLTALELPRVVRNIQRDVYLVKRESTEKTDAFHKTAEALKNICKSS